MVKYNVTEISPKAVQQHAIDNFKGGFYCCEALVNTIIDDFQIDIPKDVIDMVSGMAVGAGKSGCMCGALNGAIMALGMFFGRHEPNGPKDPDSVKCMALTHELHDWFKVATAKNAICCRILTKGFEMAEGEHKAQCHAFTGLAAGKLAEILCRELGIKNLDDEPIQGLTEPFLPSNANA